MFPDDMGRVLLPLARAAIAERLGLPGPAVPAADWLDEPGACFITLQLAGRLRGCIGTLEAWRGIGEDVEDNARSAAFRDPRFPPLSVAEYREVDLEVSVLSELEPIPCADEADLLARLRPGVDGVVLRAGRRSGTFLPQVWDQLPDPEKFVAHLKVKAGLPRRGWGPDWRCYRYGVRHWREQRTP